MPHQPVTPIPETDYRPVHPPPATPAAKRAALQKLLGGVWITEDIWLLEYQVRSNANQGWAMWNESLRPATGPGSSGA